MQELEFNDKVILITGAAGGVGRATSLLFHSLGAKLLLIDRRGDELVETMALCEKGYEVHTLVGDMTDDTFNARLVPETIQIYGKIDCLVNTAANGMMVKIDDDKLFDYYDKIMDLNVKSILRLVKACIPYLKVTKGNIVNMSTLLSDRPMKDSILYCMSKAALDNMTRCLSLELALFDIRVNSINAGAIDSNFLYNSGFCDKEENVEIVKSLTSQHFLRRNCRCDEISQAIAFLASEKRASFCTGTFLNVGGGWNLMPPCYNSDLVE